MTDAKQAVVTRVRPVNDRLETPTAMDTETIKGALVPIRDAFGADDIDVDDVHDLARAYPPEDIDRTAPVNDLALMLAGILVSIHDIDRETWRVGISTAFKKITYASDLDRFNQDAHGINAAAMARLEATHGALPNRVAYRQRLATRAERLRTWGRDAYKGKIARWFHPGPLSVITDPSYWYIARSTWHCVRPINGILQTIARPDIPCDAPPERTMGDDWRVIESLPELRIKESGGSKVKNDVDLLCAALGFRAKGGMLFHEMIHHMTVERKTARNVQQDEKEPSALRQSLNGLVAWLAVVIGVVGGFALLLTLT